MKKSLYLFLVLFSIVGNCQKQFDVYFDFNKDFPNQSSIFEYNEWLATHKKAEILKLYGYCDSVDSKNYNKKLAERRIENVYKLLSASGMKMNTSMEKIAIGKEFEQSSIQEENRRVSIIFKEIETDNPKPKSELSEKLKNAKKGESIKLPNIYFLNNSARIVQKSQPTLYDLLCALEENPKIKIEIQGHICCQEVTDINDVSTARARAIYNFLMRNKIDRKRMTFKGYGTTQPVHKIPEKSQQEEDENRRVEILITEN